MTYIDPKAIDECVAWEPLTAERDEARKLLDELCELATQGKLIDDVYLAGILRERHPSWPGWK